MAKSAQVDASTTIEPMRSFYRPHARVQYTGELLDPITGVLTKPVSRVKQSFVPECDINNILKQYSVTGQIRHISAKAAQGAYLDLPDEVDYQTALQIVKDGSDAFATLPSKTRERFDNDPTNFLDFMANPANREEAIKLGLATSRAVPAPIEPQAPSSPSAPPKAREGS